MEKRIIKSVNHRLHICSFFPTHVFSCGGFDLKWTEKHLHVVKFNNMYLLFLFHNLLQPVLWSSLQCSRVFLLLKTPALQSHVRPDTLHVRPEFPINDWIANLCALVYGEVKARYEVCGLNCSRYAFWNTVRYDTNVIQLRKTSAFCQWITCRQICSWHSTIQWFRCATFLLRTDPAILTHWGRDKMNDIFKCFFLIENVWIPMKTSLKFVPKGPINNIPALV